MVTTSSSIRSWQATALFFLSFSPPTLHIQEPVYNQFAHVSKPSNTTIFDFQRQYIVFSPTHERSTKLGTYLLAADQLATIDMEGQMLSLLQFLGSIFLAMITTFCTYVFVCTVSAVLIGLSCLAVGLVVKGSLLVASLLGNDRNIKQHDTFVLEKMLAKYSLGKLSDWCYKSIVQTVEKTVIWRAASAVCMLTTGQIYVHAFFLLGINGRLRIIRRCTILDIGKNFYPDLFLGPIAIFYLFYAAAYTAARIGRAITSGRVRVKHTTFIARECSNIWLEIAWTGILMAVIYSKAWPRISQPILFLPLAFADARRLWLGGAFLYNAWQGLVTSRAASLKAAESDTRDQVTQDYESAATTSGAQPAEDGQQCLRSVGRPLQPLAQGYMPLPTISTPTGRQSDSKQLILQLASKPCVVEVESCVLADRWNDLCDRQGSSTQAKTRPLRRHVEAASTTRQSRRRCASMSRLLLLKQPAREPVPPQLSVQLPQSALQHCDRNEPSTKAETQTMRQHIEAASRPTQEQHVKLPTLPQPTAHILQSSLQNKIEIAVFRMRQKLREQNEAHQFAMLQKDTAMRITEARHKEAADATKADLEAQQGLVGTQQNEITRLKAHIACLEEDNDKLTGKIESQEQSANQQKADRAYYEQQYSGQLQSYYEQLQSAYGSLQDFKESERLCVLEIDRLRSSRSDMYDQIEELKKHYEEKLEKAENTIREKSNDLAHCGHWLALELEEAKTSQAQTAEENQCHLTRIGDLAKQVKRLEECKSFYLEQISMFKVRINNLLVRSRDVGYRAQEDKQSALERIGHLEKQVQGLLEEKSSDSERILALKEDVKDYLVCIGSVKLQTLAERKRYCEHNGMLKGHIKDLEAQIKDLEVQVEGYAKIDQNDAEWRTPLANEEWSDDAEIAAEAQATDLQETSGCCQTSDRDDLPAEHREYADEDTMVSSQTVEPGSTILVSGSDHDDDGYSVVDFSDTESVSEAVNGALE